MWARMDATGTYPEELQSQPKDGWLPVPPGLSSVAASQMMVQGGQWVARPLLPEPQASRVGDRIVVTCAPVPDGAVCTITARDTGAVLAIAEAAGGGIELHVVTMGAVQVEVIAPRPWRPRTLNVSAQETGHG